MIAILTFSTYDSSCTVYQVASRAGRIEATLTDRVFSSITHHILGQVVYCTGTSVVQWKTRGINFTNYKRGSILSIIITILIFSLTVVTAISLIAHNLSITVVPAQVANGEETPIETD